MFVCAFILFVLSCVQVVALRQADRPSEESTDCAKDQESEIAENVQQRAVDP
jgi:Ran GTPase-activating protein (RanGAP) involved in mRNA processing and transport